jgi:hypothetical protein
MILEMLADTGKFGHHRNASSRENVFGTNTAVEKYGGAAHRTACKDDLLANIDRQHRLSTVECVLDSVCCQVRSGGGRVEENSSDIGIDKHVVIGTGREGVQISRTAIGSCPVSRVDGGGCDVGAPVLTAVRVLSIGNADGFHSSRPLANLGKCAGAWSVS